MTISTTMTLTPKSKVLNAGAIYLAAGGTGGHVIPAITLQKYLLRKHYNANLLFDNRVEYIVQSHALPSQCVRKLHTFHGNGLINKILKFVSLAYNIILLLLLFVANRPRLIIGFGGYPSVAALVAAFILRIDTILIEQNSVIGKINRLFARAAKRVLTYFPDCLLMPPHVKHECIGMIADDKCYERFTPSNLTILVTGGSQGAKVLSDAIPQVFQNLKKVERAVTSLYFQCRKEELEATQNSLQALGFKDCVVTPFFTNMTEIMASCDFIIARAGAGTIAEVCALGLPSILVPYKYAEDDHQLHNAKFLERHNAAILVEDTPELKEKLNLALQKLIHDTEVRTEIGKNVRRFASPQALERVEKIILNFY